MNDPNSTSADLCGGRDTRRRPRGWFTRLWTWVGDVDVTGMDATQRARAAVVPVLVLTMASLGYAAGFLTATEWYDAPWVIGLIAGVASSATVLTINRVLMLNPSRSFGMFILMSMITGTVGFMMAEPLIAHFDSDGIAPITRSAGSTQTSNDAVVFTDQRSDPPRLGLVEVYDETLDALEQQRAGDLGRTIRYHLVLMVVGAIGVVALGIATFAEPSVSRAS